MDYDKVSTTVVEVPASPTTKPKKDNKPTKQNNTAGSGWFPMLPKVEEIINWTVSKQAPEQGIKQKLRHKSTTLLSVNVVLCWALLTAGAVAFVVGITAASAFVDIPDPCSESSKIFGCPHLTPAQDVEVEFFGEGFLLGAPT